MAEKPVPRLLAAVGNPAEEPAQIVFQEIVAACGSDTAWELGNLLAATVSKWANSRPDGSVRLIDIMGGAINAAAWTAVSIMEQASGQPGKQVNGDVFMDAAASAVHYAMLERAGEAEPETPAKAQNAPSSRRTQ